MRIIKQMLLDLAEMLGAIGVITLFMYVCVALVYALDTVCGGTLRTDIYWLHLTHLVTAGLVAIVFLMLWAINAERRSQ